MTVFYSESSDKVNLEGELDHFYDVVKDQLLRYQHPISGLFPLNPKDSHCKYSHVRDSVYCATVVWALHRAFARVDDNAGRHFELGQCAVKCMRTILIGWMHQSGRLEQFKKVQNAETCLNSRLDYATGEPVNDPSYRNLQMDCVGLFVIQLAQMIASGLQVVYTRDEVAFMQNLTFYLERAYRIPDYGMWERGTKQNRNLVELNASSIGMAKAALESVSGLNVYGAEGSHSSVLLTDIDAHSRNRIILTNLLPRESGSKGSDASLIPAMCWPAYGASKTEASDIAVARCVERLKGRYGFRRFTRDGYATVLDQDACYQPGELMKFMGIESEWPMFFAYLVIEYCMRVEPEQARKYDSLLQPLLVHPVSEAYPWLPKYFYVPMDDLDKERQSRGTVSRRSSFRVCSDPYFLWGQSIYLISQLLMNGCLTPNDLDPIGRCPAWPNNFNVLSRSNRMLTDKPLNLTIQVVLIAESTRLQQLLATYGILTQTPTQVEPIQIWPPDQLVRVGKFMGCSQSLGLSGRPPRPVGQLGTSRFYRISGLTVLCYPLLFEAQDFYLLHDMQVVIDEVKSDFKFLSDWWRLPKRPTFCFLIKEDMVKVSGFDQLLRFLVRMKNDTVHGINIVLGRAQKFVSSGCVEHLDFLPLWTATGDYFQRLHEIETARSFSSLENLSTKVNSTTKGGLQVKFGNSSTNVPNSNEVIRMMHAIDRANFRDFSDDRLLGHICLSDEDAYSIAGRVAAVHELLVRHDLDYIISTPKQRTTIRECLTELGRLAGIQQLWCVVRLCAALLSQFVNSLAPSLSIILVCGKQITIGVAQGSEVIVNKPLNPDELYEVLRESVYSYDAIQFSLQQELILWVGSLLTSDKNLFTGIKVIRLGWLLEAMKLNLEHENINNGASMDKTAQTIVPNEHIVSRSLGACHLYSLPPCMVKDLLLRTLRAGQEYARPPPIKSEGSRVDLTLLSSAEHRRKIRRMRLPRRREDSPRSTTHFAFAESIELQQPNALYQRQLDGCLGRMPPTFYESLYHILERSPHGVLICQKLLHQKPTLMDMTPYNLNFIDEVEFLLRPIGEPAYRSLFVETVMVIAVILQRNHELSFKDTVDIKAIIQNAMDAFAADRRTSGAVDQPTHVVRRLSWPDPDVIRVHDMATYSEFTATPANVHMGTTSYLAKATLDQLLQGQIDLSGVSKDACCVM